MAAGVGEKDIGIGRLIKEPERDGVRVEGETYPLGLHGFARHQAFSVEAQSESYVRLSLRANAETRRLYPFEFAC